MDQNVMVEEGFANPCCITWKQKYTKLKERQAKLEQGRNALKECVKILEPQLSKFEADNLALKKECQDEKARADNEREQREREYAMRVTLENELDALKIECQMLQQDGSASSENSKGEVQRLEECISEREEEINRLKGLVENEKLRANAEKKRADAEKKRAESEVRKANDALKKVKEDNKVTDLERKQYDENRVKLEVLKTELAQVKVNLEETVKQLEIEKLRADSVEKRAESERIKADEALKKVKEDKRVANDESKCSEEYRAQLEVLKAEIVQVKLNFEETKKQLDKEKTRADAEKKRADAEKKRAESVRKKANEAEKKVKEDTRLADVERKKSEESRVQLDALKAEIVQVKMDLEETKKQLDKEKTRADAEKKRADAEKKISESERKKANEAERKVKVDTRIVDVERKKSEESRVQFEALKTEIVQVKAALEETKKQLEKERTRADAEKTRADMEKKRAEYERKKGNEAVKKMREDYRLDEKRKYKENTSQLEVLKTGTVGGKENIEENKSQLENESRKSRKRKKCGDLAVTEGYDPRKLAEVNYEKAMNEKCRADTLTLQLEKERERVSALEREISELATFKNSVVVPGDFHRQIKVGAAFKTKHCPEMTGSESATRGLGADFLEFDGGVRKIMKRQQEMVPERKPVGNRKTDQQMSGNDYEQPSEEKHLVEQLHQEVTNNKLKIQEMQSVIENLLSSKNLLTSPLSIKNSESESSKIRLLRKKLKFEKTLVKHANQVAELEVGRNSMLQYELGKLKQEILKFSEHLTILDNPALRSDAGIAGPGKLCSSQLKRKHSHEQPHPINLFSNQGLMRPCSTGNASHSKYSVKCSAPLHEGCSGETISGRWGLSYHHVN